MGLFTRGKIWISEDRASYIEYDKGTQTCSLVVDGTTVMSWKSDSIGFYGTSAGTKPSMTLTASSAIGTTTISQVDTTGVHGFASSTAAEAFVTRVTQMQADLETLVGKLEGLGLLSVTGN